MYLGKLIEIQNEQTAIIKEIKALLWIKCTVAFFFTSSDKN